jgi:hypothetical protein
MVNGSNEPGKTAILILSFDMAKDIDWGKLRDLSADIK